MQAAAEPFRIEVTESAIRDLTDRLERTRWADDFANDDWRYGMPASYLRPLVDYWLHSYDWRAQEAKMNAYPHYRVSINGAPIHFIHQPGRGRQVLPLILTHGWPWSFWDFAALIGPLSDPAAHGAPDEIAFEVIVPSLPGFGFSSPLRRTGLSAAIIADMWAELMCDVLGFERFLAHGGDMGAFVTANLAHAHADRLIGAHLSFPALVGVDFAAGTPFVGPEDYGPDEQGWYARWTARMATARAHSIVHRASPQTLGWAFNDSPVGLASWIIERRRLWSDNDGDVEQAFSKDMLLTLVSIYWFTQTAHTSMRAYAEMGLNNWVPRHARTPVMEAPTGMAIFPRDLLLLPRRMVERHANLVHWSVQPRGGHFAAAEAPELLTADLRQFASSVAGR